MTVTSSIDPFEKDNASFDAGRTIEHLQQRLVAERARFDALMVDLENLQTDLIAKNREIASVKRELTKRENASVAEAEVQAVWDEYVDVVAIRKDVVLDDARRKLIRDRIRDIRQAPNVDEEPVERLKRACHGRARKPYVKAGGGRVAEKLPGAVRYAKPEHVFRDMAMVEACLDHLEPDASPEAPTPIRRYRTPEDPPAEKVLNALRHLDLDYRAAWGAGTHSVGKWMAQCPAHEDREASLSIREAGDRVLLNCFAGCEVTAICDALGLSLSELFERRPA